MRHSLSYRDVEELLVERGVEVDHVTVHRWVQRFTPLLTDAARPCRHAVGNCWFVDETYVKVAGRWRFVYRPIDQHGEIVTDKAPALARAIRFQGDARIDVVLGWQSNLAACAARGPDRRAVPALYQIRVQNQLPTQ